MSEVETPRFVTFTGARMALEGPQIRVGSAAPGFSLTNGKLEAVSLNDFQGRVLLLAAVPSLDTGVCDMEARRFEKEVAELDDRIAYVTVSMDLPFAQARWCGAAEAHRVVTLSDYKHHLFGKDYGVYIPELGLLARSVFVIDPKGVVRYVEIVPEVTHEPNYDAALAKAKELAAAL